MTFLPSIDILSAIEPLLLGAGLLAFVRVKAYKTFPAFFTYLIFRLSIYLILDILLHAARWGVVEKHAAYAAYYYIYWPSYIAGAWVAFLVIQEIFRHIMSPAPGLGRLGLVVFRWVIVTSVLASLALSILPAHINGNLLIAITSGLMRCMSILELCLLAFIVLFMQTLDISLKSRDFGVALGLATIAAAELFGSAFAFGHSSMASIANYCSQIAVTLAMCIWIGYFLKRIAEPEPGALPSSSPLRRWNEIASALGHPAPQIALGTSTDFFLQDVEKAVDRVLEKNPMNAAR
jgi:hypothetical protein